MDGKTDSELSDAYRAGDRSAGDALVVRHEGIVRAVVRAVRYPAGVDVEDLMQVGRLALLAAARTPEFDHDRTLWTTYAMTCARRAVWKEVARQAKQAAGLGRAKEWSALDCLPARTLARQWFADALDQQNPTVRLLVADAEAGLSRAAIAGKYGMTTLRVRNYLSLGYKFLTGDEVPTDARPTGPDTDEADGGGEPGDLRVVRERDAA